MAERGDKLYECTLATRHRGKYYGVEDAKDEAKKQFKSKMADPATFLNHSEVVCREVYMEKPRY